MAAGCVQADDPDLQQDGLSNTGKGKSRKGQGRWLSRWLARDGSNRKQGKEKAGSKKPEVHAPQQNLETKSLEPRKAPPAVQGPGKLARPLHRDSLVGLAVHDLPLLPPLHLLLLCILLLQGPAASSRWDGVQS